MIFVVRQSVENMSFVEGVRQVVEVESARIVKIGIR